MHFKIAVFHCVAYFFTSVLSIGLNGDQIKTCIELSKLPRNNKNEIDLFEEKITKAFFSTEMNAPFFEYNSDVADYINLKNLFLALAYEDNKIGDSFEIILLTSFEVEFFIGLFIGHAEHHNQEGYLYRNQTSELFNPDHLTLAYDEKNEAKILMNHLGDSNGVINVAEFLLIALKIQPKGHYGLYEKHIKMFLDLNEEHITETGCIKRSEIQKIFKKFDMANKTHEELMLFKFKSNQPAAKELMELMLVTAQRSREGPSQDTYMHDPLSPVEVRSLICEFTTLYSDNDGILSKNEALEFQRQFYAKNRRVLFEYNIDDKEEINVVGFFEYYIVKKICNSHNKIYYDY